MNKNLLYILTLPFFIAGCSTKCIEDLGIQSNRAYTVKPFNEIKLDGPIKLVLLQDSSFRINVQADSAVIGSVKAEVRGQQLELKLDANSYCGSDSIVVSAGIGALKKIKADGASNISTSALINVEELKMELSGATALKMQMNAAKLITTTDGEANLELTGQAGVHEVKSKGSIQLNAFDFVTGTSDLNLEGVAKLQVNALNELKIKSTGSAGISYKGSPKKITEKNSGTYKLDKVN